MARKTVSIEYLLDSHERCTNGSLANDKDSPEALKAMRKGINILVECALHETGNYKGFQYLGDYKIDDTAIYFIR